MYIGINVQPIDHVKYIFSESPDQNHSDFGGGGFYYPQAVILQTLLCHICIKLLLLNELYSKKN